MSDINTYGFNCNPCDLNLNPGDFNPFCYDDHIIFNNMINPKRKKINKKLLIEYMKQLYILEKNNNQILKNNSILTSTTTFAVYIGTNICINSGSFSNITSSFLSLAHNITLVSDNTYYCLYYDSCSNNIFNLQIINTNDTYTIMNINLLPLVLKQYSRILF